MPVGCRHTGMHRSKNQPTLTLGGIHFPGRNAVFLSSLILPVASQHAASVHILPRIPPTLAPLESGVCLHRVLSAPLTLPIHIALVYLLQLFPPSQMKLEQISCR